MLIRVATLADLNALVEGNRAMAEETEALRLPLETVRTGVRRVLEGLEAGAYRVVEVDGRVAAQLMITYEWSDWRARNVWWIQSVYVWPEYRGRGLFKELYRATREAALAAGAGGLRLYVDERNTRAQEVYRALGMSSGHYRVCEEMFVGLSP
ncbi:MAG: GNAT family N-acetyltransferase [Deltaproteobacteria bacterium]|nr:GNAT family N-acetyltransferase [Deltaproteobacteria bacterium]